MNCKLCGGPLREGADFCHNCGSKIQRDPDTWAPDAWQEQKRFCPNCGQLLPEDVRQCPNCSSQEAAPAPKKRKGLVWILVAAASAILVLGIVIAGLLTDWFGLNGPMAQIGRAAQKTARAESMTVDYEIEISGMTMEGRIDLVLDLENRNIMALGDMTIALLGQTAEGQLALYEDQLIIVTEGRYSYQDMSQQMEAIYDAYEEDREVDWQEVLETLLGEETAEMLDGEEFGRCLASFSAQKLNNRSWLRENAGYSLEKEDDLKSHCFQVNAYEFLEVSLPSFADAFRDEENYEEALDSLEEREDDLDQDMEIVMGIRSGYLAILEYEVEELVIKLELEEFNRTQVDEDTLEEMLEKAQNDTNMGL